jgi:hypothetical protein
MASLPAEILLGIYLGLLVGILPALVAWTMGFVFRYFTGVTLPGFGVTILAIGIAGVNGGLLALTDQRITQSPNAGRVITAIIVVGLLSMYAHSKGDQMAAEFPRRLSLSDLRSQTISRELAELVHGGDEVRVRVVGEVADMEGYPPLSEELRAEVRNAEMTFPADLRLDELESRVEDRLRAEYDLGDVSASIDEGGRATVVAAPPFSGLSKRVADGRHAVSVSGLLPTGLARGDEVTLITPDAQVPGTVVSASTGATDAEDETPLRGAAIEESVAEDRPTPVRAPTTNGGEGRLTVAVTRTDVQPLLRADGVKIVVESRGTRREYEVISMLRRADRQFRRFVVRGGSPIAGQHLGAPALHEETDASVLAVRKPAGWQVAPRGETILESGDELFVAGTRDELDAIETVLSRA